MEKRIVLVFGHLFSLDKRTGKLELSLDSKMRVIAAGELYKRGSIHRIIVSGGKTSGEKLPSVAEVMSNYLIRHFSIPDEAIIKEGESIDTVDNIDRSKRILENKKIKGQIIALSNQYHIKRIKKLLAILGLSADMISAEDVLIKRYGSHSFVGKYLDSCGIKVKRIKERILRGLLYIDPKGQIPRKITERTRR